MSQGSFKNIIYVKDQKVLQASDFWADMSQTDADLMIFDDMDQGLQPRNNKKETDFTSNLLSFSNGIFDKSTKIIITTNQEIAEIDAALVRPGRCFDFLTLHPLSYDQARGIWVNILNRPVADFERLYAGQKTVTQASLMSDYNRESHSFKERSYVKNGIRNYNVQSKLQASGVNVK
jgi:SpoVK/Ycf46/Vps4 family AAA+-type ATPase